MIDSRGVESGDAIRRRRGCEVCGKRWTTKEHADIREPLVIDGRGQRGMFIINRVKATINKCCAKLPVSWSDRDMAVEKVRQWAYSLGTDIHIDDLIAEIAKALDAVHPVARLRFDLEYQEPQDAADCLIIVAKAMARFYQREQK